MVRVVFVCSGNICRSPMAEKVFAEHLRRAGLHEHVEVSSVGTEGWHVGEPADPRAVEVLARRGYRTRHAAAQLAHQHAGADLLVALDSGHARALRRLVRDPDRVRLLRSFDPDVDADADVPDPYYGADRGFDEVLDMIEAAMPGMIAWVRERM